MNEARKSPKQLRANEQLPRCGDRSSANLAAFLALTVSLLGASGVEAQDPAMVTDLSVVGQTSETLTVEFTEVNDGLGGPANYELRWDTPPPIDWGTATAAPPELGNSIGATRQVTITGLDPNTSYGVQVVAYRGTLNQGAVFGPLSNTDSGATDPSPSQVTTLTVIDETQTTLTLQFTQVNDGSGVGAEYQVRWNESPIDWGTASGSMQHTGSGVMGSPTQVVIAGLDPDTEYQVQVVAYRGTLDVDAEFGPLSNVATGTTDPPPDPAMVNDLSIIGKTSTTLTVRFTEVDDGLGDPAKYEIRWNTTPIDWATASGSLLVTGTQIAEFKEAMITGLSPGTSYQVQVVAYRGTLNAGAVFGPLSNIDGDTTHPAPSQVTNLAVIDESMTTLTVQFTQVNDGLGGPADYQVRWDEAPIDWGTAPGSMLHAGTAIGQSAQVVITGLDPDTDYEVQVVAYRGTLNVDAVFSPLSNIAPGTTDPPPDPDRVSDLTVIDETSTTLTVRFTQVDDGTGAGAKYELRWNTSPIDWGTAAGKKQISAGQIGQLRQSTITGLEPGTEYQVQIVAYRGTLNVDAVFSPLSNVAQGATDPLPDKVNDLQITDQTTTSLTVRFTEVDDGFGGPADYVVRWSTPPIDWGTAQNELQVFGTQIGQLEQVTIGGLQPGTEYDVQVVAYRGTLNQDAVFSPLSNVASGTTDRLPVIARDPGEMNFLAALGGSDPPSQPLYISNDGDEVVQWSVGADQDWLSLSPTDGTLDGIDEVTVSVDIENLVAGIRHATITISAPGATNSPQTTQVTLEVSEAPLLVVDSPIPAEFSAQVLGPDPDPIEVTIDKDGLTIPTGLAVGPVEYGEAGPAGWLAGVLDGTTTPATLTLTATVGQIEAGTHFAEVPITSPDAVPVAVPVVFVVTDAASIVADPEAVEIIAQAAGPDPEAVEVSIDNGGTGVLDELSLGDVTYGEGESAGWLSALLDDADAPATLTLTPTSAALAAGSYHAVVPVVSPRADNSPLELHVTMTVTQTAVLSTSPAAVELTVRAGAESPAPTEVAVTNAGDGVLGGLGVGPIAYGPDEPVGWLSAELDGESSPATLLLTSTTSDLSPGTYTALVPLESPSADNSPLELPVTLVVSDAPTLVVVPAEVDWTAMAGSPDPQAVVVAVSSPDGASVGEVGVDEVAFEPPEASGWLSVTAPGGPLPLEVELGVDTEGLAPGEYSATVRLGTDNPFTQAEIEVTLVVLDATPLAVVVDDFLAGSLPQAIEDYLDGIGNQNGQVDIGDFLAWFDQAGAPAPAAAAALQRLQEGQP